MTDSDEEPRAGRKGPCPATAAGYGPYCYRPWRTTGSSERPPDLPTGNVPSSPQSCADRHAQNLRGQCRHRTLWQIYDPAGDVSTVHETEAEFVQELTESLRTSPANTELRVSRLAS
jgi:hypothetical protein